MSHPPCPVVLVCGGRFHDFDFVRHNLLTRLLARPAARTRVFEDYANTNALDQAQALITYTADVIPDDPPIDALERFLARGGRWFALHGSNAIVQIEPSGHASVPRIAPRFMNLLGSQFVAHPPKGPFVVHNAQPDHPLTAGIESFEVTDELYLVEQHGQIDTLLYSQFSGQAMKGFVEREFPSDEPRPILYLKHHDPGAVLYLNLGHCRGHLDMQPLMDWYPEVERCSWDHPVFSQLLDRGIDWMLESRDD